MARIKFYRVYTNLVEHYFRLAVRYEYVSKDRAQEWHTFTRTWFDCLTKEDYDFITFVFQSCYLRTDFALYEYVSPGNENLPKTVNYDINRSRLYELERKFAIDAGLIGEGEFNDENEEERS